MPFRRTHGIYRIRNIVSGSCYIGSAVSLDRRRREHFKAMERGTHQNQALQRAWNKYGQAALVFEVLELLSDVRLLVGAEQRWIDSESPRYNIAKIAGSTLGIPCSPEKALKISESKRGVPRLIPPEVRAKMAASLRRHKRTPEHRANLSAANLGKKLSESHRALALRTLQFGQRGEKNPQARLNEALVRSIFDMKRQGLKQIEVATRLGLSKQIVSSILTRRSWSHIVI